MASENNYTHNSFPASKMKTEAGKGAFAYSALVKRMKYSAVCCCSRPNLGHQQQFLLTLHSILATCTWTQNSLAFPSVLTLLEKLCCLLVWHAKGQELLLGERIWLGQCPFFFLRDTSTAVLQPNVLAPSQHTVTSGWPVQGMVSLCNSGWAFPAKIHVQPTSYNGSVSAWLMAKSPWDVHQAVYWRTWFRFSITRESPPSQESSESSCIRRYLMSILGGSQPQPRFRQWPRWTTRVNMNIPVQPPWTAAALDVSMGRLCWAGGRKRRGTDFARAGCNCRVRLCPFPPAALQKFVLHCHSGD